MALFVLEPLHKVARNGTGDDEWTWKGCFGDYELLRKSGKSIR